MSKCISIAQARTKCGPRSWAPAFHGKFSLKLALVKCPSACRLCRLAQSVGPGFGIGPSPQHHHLPPPQHRHSQHHHLPPLTSSASTLSSFSSLSSRLPLSTSSSSPPPASSSSSPPPPASSSSSSISASSSSHSPTLFGVCCRNLWTLH